MVKNLPSKPEMQVQSLSRDDPLDKEMATHSSILDWAIPWRETPAGLQSMGSQRLGNYTPITTTIAMTVNIEHL